MAPWTPAALAANIERWEPTGQRIRRGRSNGESALLEDDEVREAVRVVRRTAAPDKIVGCRRGQLHRGDYCADRSRCRRAGRAGDEPSFFAVETTASRAYSTTMPWPMPRPYRCWSTTSPSSRIWNMDGATAARIAQLRSAAGLAVYIEFAPDPDIIIRVQMSAQQYRNVVAIEIKGGTDISNVHNRIGEAEKSHQKARQEGFTECWTVVNVDHLDVDKAHKESPSTNRFYSLSALASRSGAEYEDFAMRIRSLAAIPSR